MLCAGRACGTPNDDAVRTLRLARELLGWQSRRDLAAMCEDSWRWQRLNPNGFTN